MIRFGRRGILSPGEMFPAGDAAYRVNFPRLRSGIMVRAVERGNPTSPPVVLVHGWGCSAYVFRRNMPALAEAGFRAIAIDLNGHGLLDKPVARKPASASAGILRRNTYAEQPQPCTSTTGGEVGFPRSTARTIIPERRR